MRQAISKIHSMVAQGDLKIKDLTEANAMLMNQIHTMNHENKNDNVLNNQTHNNNDML